MQIVIAVEVAGRAKLHIECEHPERDVLHRNFEEVLALIKDYAHRAIEGEVPHEASDASPH